MLKKTIQTPKLKKKRLSVQAKKSSVKDKKKRNMLILGACGVYETDLEILEEIDVNCWSL